MADNQLAVTSVTYESMSNDELHKQVTRDFYTYMLKNVKMLERLGIEWEPYSWSATSAKQTFEIAVMLPKHNVMIEVRLRLGRKAQVLYGNAFNRLCEIRDGQMFETEYFSSMQMLFEVLKARYERGDALIQGKEYRKEHCEDALYLKDYREWKMRHGKK